MQQYKNLLRDILANGEAHSDRTGIGTTSVFGRQLRFDLWHVFPMVTVKRVPFRWVAEELLWILSGSTNSKDLEKRGVDMWKEWAGEDGDLGPTYGFQLRHFGGDRHFQWKTPIGGYDQVRWLCEEIVVRPNSRRLVLTYWNPEQLNAADGVFPPCHVSAQFKVHEERRELSCHLFQRSADAFLGLPFDIAGYALLTTLLAEVSSLAPRELIVSIGDAHVYDNHREQVEEVLGRDPTDPPRLRLLDPLKRIRGAGFQGLMTVKSSDLELEGYRPHGKVEAPVAV